MLSGARIAKRKSAERLPAVLKSHKSLIRRKLHNTDLYLQENKAGNLHLAAQRITQILICPGETFSFWELVGRPSHRKGYREGVTITKGRVHPGIGGGLCQLTNLLHWMVLHTDLTITEHWHHNGMDLFPDFKRQIPFGTGTSIFYKALDYRCQNNSDKTYQIIVYTTDQYLCGEMRSSEAMQVKVHIREEDSYFYERDGVMYRHNRVFRKVNNKTTGDCVEEKLLFESNAQVMYEKELIDQTRIKQITDCVPV